MDKKLKAFDGNNRELHEHDIVTDFRGVHWFFVSATRANDEAHDGKVFVQHYVTAQVREFYARVFNLTVKL
jgi:hypothetical protein